MYRDTLFAGAGKGVTTRLTRLSQKVSRIYFESLANSRLVSAA